MLIADDQTLEVTKMSEQPLDIPTPFITPELSAVSRLGLLAIYSVWRDHLDTF